MNPESLNLWVALPEVLLLVAACCMLLIEALAKPKARRTAVLLALFAMLLPFLVLLASVGDPVAHYGFSGLYVADPLARVLKLCAIVAVAVTLIYARRYGEDRGIPPGEFNLLALFSLLGQMLMISANNLLMIYLGLELMSLSLYAMIALRRDDHSAVEAAMKYFFLGALASGFLLYGMSMVYGAAGTLALPEIAEQLRAGGLDTLVFSFGVVFIVAGLAFKFSAVPFHMWAPDVYHGAPTSVTLLIGGAPKFATFAMAFRLLVEALPDVWADWQPMLIVLAVASLAIGNIVAIAQTNLKRMLAWSAIGQIGFVLLGFASGFVDGDDTRVSSAWGASLFYVIAYVLTTLGTFGLIQILSRRGFESDEIADLAGLNRRSPWIAFVMLILMFSLTGIPPFIGFYAKLVVLGALIDAGLVWLAVLAVIFSLISAFYYLRVVKVMYFDEPVDVGPIEAGRAARATLALNGFAVLALGILPGPLMGACLQAVRIALLT